MGTSAKAPEWHSRICLPLIFLLCLSLQPQSRVGSSVGTAGDLLHRTTAKTMEVLTTTGLNTKAVLTAVSDHRWWKDSLNYLRPLHVRTLRLCCFINSSIFCEVLNGCTNHLVGLKKYSFYALYWYKYIYILCNNHDQLASNSVAVVMDVSALFLTLQTNGLHRQISCLSALPYLTYFCSQTSKITNQEPISCIINWPSCWIFQYLVAARARRSPGWRLMASLVLAAIGRGDGDCGFLKKEEKLHGC